MKKIYLLLLLSLLSFKGFSYHKWYATVFNGDMTNFSTWNDDFAGGGLHPTTFSSPVDSWFIYVPIYLPDGGNFTLGGTLIFDFGYSVLRKGTTAGIINVGGSICFPSASSSPSGPGFINSVAGAGHFTLTTGKDLIMLGTSHITDSTTSTTDINIAGNLVMADNSYISSVSGGFTTIHFNGLAPFGTPQTITWTSTAPSKYTNFFIDAPNNVELLSDVPLPTLPDPAGERLNGTLICNTFGMNGDGTQNFYINPGANIYTANTGGMDSSVKHCTNFFNGAANYVFNGVAPQISGITLPSTMDSSGTVTIDNTTGVTLSKNITFDSTSACELMLGTFHNSLADSILTMKQGATVFVDSGTFSSAPTYQGLVKVVYENLGYDALAVTTGNELLPIAAGFARIDLFVSKAGATITLGATPSITVQDVVLNGGALDASASNYNINLDLTWQNYSGLTAFVPRAGSVNFVNDYPVSRTMYLYGSSQTTFNNVTLSNRNGLILNAAPGSTGGTDEYINGTLTLDTGNLYIFTHNLIFGPSATAVAGTLTDTTMIVADSTGQVIKQMSADGSFLYPVGDSTNYTPITLNFSGSGAYGAGAEAGVNLRPKKEPRNADTANYLDRYWSVAATGITAPSYTASATYVPGDVVGFEAEMAAGVDTGALPFMKFGLTSVATHTLTFGVVTDSVANFTGIDTLGPTVTLSDDTIMCVGGFDTLRVLGATGDTPFTYVWAPAAGLSATTGTVVVATPTVTTTYTVTVTDGNGASGTDTVRVTVNAVPTLDSAHNNGPICSGNTLALTA